MIVSTKPLIIQGVTFYASKVMLMAGNIPISMEIKSKKLAIIGGRFVYMFVPLNY